MKRKKGVQFAGVGLDTGGGGVTDYDDLSNKPQIGGVTLTGSKTLADLGAQSALTFDNTPTENSSNPITSGGTFNALGEFNNVRMKAIDYTYDNPTVANTEYTIPNAKATVLGLPNSATVCGFGLCQVGGNQEHCFNTTIMYSQSGDFLFFKPTGSNNIAVRIFLTVFYTL